ncbi:MAG: cobalamin biosynthesis protein [Oscillospiraceae bacterium]|nr:cobalamin biosynthesis protein [Oscillospiraceae bacterium]
MKAAALAFTDHGMLVGNQLEGCCDSLCLTRCPKGGLAAWTEAAFNENDALIYIGAVGIAVRAISPFVKKKNTDPCVLVIDEQGKYVIPVLSGHIGGGNDLACRLADRLGARAIITTATDINGLFAVDSWAVKQGLYVSNCENIKLVSGKLLEGRMISFHSDFPIVGSLPDHVAENTEAPDFYIGYHKPAASVLHLIPRNVTVGIGCRKGIAREAVENGFAQACLDAGIPAECVISVASVDLKKEEAGLLAFCQGHSLPFQTYSSEELAALEGEFSPSAFVRSITGVDNVCERSAVKHSGGNLIFKKKAYNGVTVAFAAPVPVISWED